MLSSLKVRTTVTIKNMLMHKIWNKLYIISWNWRLSIFRSTIILDPHEHPTIEVIGDLEFNHSYESMMVLKISKSSGLTILNLPYQERWK